MKAMYLSAFCLFFQFPLVAGACGNCKCLRQVRVENRIVHEVMREQLADSEDQCSKGCADIVGGHLGGNTHYDFALIDGIACATNSQGACYTSGMKDLGWRSGHKGKWCQARGYYDAAPCGPKAYSKGGWCWRGVCESEPGNRKFSPEHFPAKACY